MRARYPSLRARSDNEEALKHVLKDACEQVHLEYSHTRFENPASNGRGENSVRTMKEMVQRQKDVVFSLVIEFSIEHPLFALLVRHSECDDHESKRHKNSDDTVPMAQEPSSGSGVKRSNIEAIRRC